MDRRPIAMLLALTAFAALPASASAFTTGLPVPRIEAITPAQVDVGQLMDITGENFARGRWRNQIVFVRPGIRPVFVLADVANERLIRLRVPAKLLPFLEHRDGQPMPTRFRLTVMSDRLNPQFIPTDRSPLIAPPGTGAPVAAGIDCDSDGDIDTPLPDQRGVPLVGLQIPGVPLAGQEAPTVPDVAGLPGIPDVGLPPVGLPEASTPESAAPPVCPPPGAAPGGGNDDAEDEDEDEDDSGDDDDDEDEGKDD